MRLRLTIVATLVGAILGAVIAVAAIQFWSDDDVGAESATPVSTPAASSDSATGANSSGQVSAGSECLSAAEIYDQVRPAVVQIVSTVRGSTPFGPQAEGTGSGIVIDQSGTILTNHHVIADADTLEVRFADGTVASAQVVGRDPGNDLALIRADVSGQELSVATLGDSDAVRVGDPVLAIGSPFNLEGTLTQGIVSALGRTYSQGGSTRPIRDMIQTDAAVNPGNSGGPLLDCEGEVIGINTLLENPAGDDVNVGVAFAVPIRTAERSLPEMSNGETIAHPWLGIAGQEVTPALADDLGLTTEAGVYVTLVAAGTPADAVGLRGAFRSESEAARSSSLPSGGDVILAADDQTVTSVEDLAGYLDEQKRPGDTVNLKIARDGQELSLQATLAEWPG